MLKQFWHPLLFVLLAGFASLQAAGQAQAPAPKYLIKDLDNNPKAPADCVELIIPSHGSRMAAFMYTAVGSQPHPTLILLHGFPGNERNLDLAQSIRRTGWNVLYFNYRGSWGSEGEFSFANCVEDVTSVVAFCRKQAKALRIDSTRLALFGHSMGGWVALKALAQLPTVRKAVILSPWDIYASAANTDPLNSRAAFDQYTSQVFMLRIPEGKSLLAPVLANAATYQLNADGPALRRKTLLFLDETKRNQAWIKPIGAVNKAYFHYEVWPTDHPFTSKRIALTKTVIAFLNK
ncbi:alpha/beta hydrolase family protein [Hymenobacter terrenus]|uniref:alpha/beta hydrolase family protein n=1 Tax=Hymenobacter terrenus TaxID=1629124 RepID=UPI000695D187|nr:alpha/beta fold hydrolase [Hymenobacter terrenus]